jgi:hypothetical protein
MRIFILLSFFLCSCVNAQELTAEQKIIAMTIAGEARGEGKLGMYCAATVIAQRSIAWGETPTQVCLKKWQFSCWNPDDPNRAKLPRLLDTPAGEYAQFLAINLKRLDRKFTGNADHYCHVNKNPSWSFKTVTRKGKPVKIPLKPTKVIGNHKFYRLR